jgi:hypothetical protein
MTTKKTKTTSAKTSTKTTKTAAPKAAKTSGPSAKSASATIGRAHQLLLKHQGNAERAKAEAGAQGDRATVEAIGQIATIRGRPEQVAAPAQPAAPAKGADTKAKTGRKPSVASVARGLILAGKTNEEVFGALHKQFELPEEKKHYPAWYRAQLVREEKKANGAKAAEALKAKLAKTAHPAA